MTLLGLAGWGLLARRQWRLALCFGVAFLMQLFLNAAVSDWWAGWSFGMRRMTESSIDITRQVIAEHYGSWAWSHPGP